MTFAVLRALHNIIGEALDDIQRVYDPQYVPSTHTSHSQSQCQDIHDVRGPQNGEHPPYASPPPSPSISSGVPPLDFPSLDTPYDPADPAEQLTGHPIVVVAIKKIVASTAQMASMVQLPFLSLFDASMGYHLPSCVRLLEASHTAEILREAGPTGLHVDMISEQTGVESTKLAHILRLLATHHILRERKPNVFTANRISSLLDSGKSVSQLRQWEKQDRPEMKYHDTNGIVALIGLNTDELQKSSAYLTEAYLLSRTDPPRVPFEFSFNTTAGYFAWLEGEGTVDIKQQNHDRIEMGPRYIDPVHKGSANPNIFRLERFGKAMSGTESWEAPGAVLTGFDWQSLPQGSVVVDVGGGIGSTSMLLANAFSRPHELLLRSLPPTPGNNEESDEAIDLSLQFVIQDREVVVEMGLKAWRARCPELLDSGTAKFQVHDFFSPQPIRNAAVFFLRVVLHDWPNAHARTILLRLREAATEATKLVLADFILPLACVDTSGDGLAGDDGVLDGVEGAESMLAPAPLLANLGKASAHAYSMDMTMQMMFNAQERTLREIVALTLSAGWKVVKVTRPAGSLFGHIVAVPVAIPIQNRARAGSGSALLEVPSATSRDGLTTDRTGVAAVDERDGMERARSRCGTPTFGSRMELPSVKATMAKFGGGIVRLRPGTLAKPAISKQAVAPTPPVKLKKKPSPLSFSPSPKPLPPSPQPPSSPRQPQASSPILARRMSHASLYRLHSPQGSISSLPTPISRDPPPSPLSPRHSHLPRPLVRRGSHAHLSQGDQARSSLTSPVPPSPSLPLHFALSPNRPTLSRRPSHAHLTQPPQLAPSAIPLRQFPTQESPPSRPPQLSSPIAPRHNGITRRFSYAQLPQASLRKRSGSILGPSINGGIGGGISMGSLLDSGGGEVSHLDRHEKPNDRPFSNSRDGAGTVLAAAARIERGVPPRAPSP
ncbi:hypothetical protein BDZ94DRAFT_1309633 [Collybia nuda]|uniref:O-methyltransferase C-terminal domain-containing protein n=1 Tax=Collybia nuda TaxID=64659 RepID=A0A9P5Y330_9AGAR|nr:hypothetical protein BDZ94DRAFT_1309633 [Collybia nuda]